MNGNISQLVEIVRRRLNEYGYVDAETEEAADVPLVALLSTPRRRMVRYLCAVTTLPASVADYAGLSGFMRRIRTTLARCYARFPYFKDMGTFTVLLCSGAQYEEFGRMISGFKDRTGLHVNVMLGTCLVDVDRGRSTGESTWGLYYSGKHYGALRAAISEWGEQFGKQATIAGGV